MTNSSSNAWEVTGWPDAYRKVIGSDHEDPEETKKDVSAILLDVNILNIKSALEIGAGYGRLVKEMLNYIPYVIGIDSSQALVDMSYIYLDTTIFGIPKVFKGDGFILPAATGFFDFVYSYIAFQHMHTLDVIKSYIAEAFRVLKSGGVCRIQTVKGKSNPSMVEGGLHRCHLFENENDFLQLFIDAGFAATVEVGVTHFQHIWVTGHKP